MRKHFTYITGILLILAGGLTGCKKHSDIIVSTGSISGKYTPARSAAGAVAIKISGTGSMKAKLDSSNGFNITSLEAGNYKIGYAAMPGFIAPDTVLVTVVAGENFDIGTVVFDTTRTTGTGRYGSISGKISPAPAATSIVATGVTGSLGYTVIPDSSGNFRINDIAPGAHTVSFIALPGYSAPNNMSAMVTAGQNTDIGSLVFNPKVYTRKAIDTISEAVKLSSAEAVNDFVNRANMDSAIVLSSYLQLGLPSITLELANALNKIIATKSLWISNITNSSLAFKSLTEVNLIYIYNAPNLTSLDLNALKTFSTAPAPVGSISISFCPALQNLNLAALSQFAGSLSLNATGFKDFSFFNKVRLKPFVFTIEYNKQLTTLRGLNFASDSVANFTIRANPVLASLDGLQDLKRLTSETLITGNPELQILTGLDHVVFANPFTLTNNLKLSTVCAARQIINLLKDAPDYTVRQMNSLGNWVVVTKQALIASGNGLYATRADLIAAIAKCP